MYWIQSQFVQVNLNYNLIHNWANQRACLVVARCERKNVLVHKAFRVNSHGNVAVFMDFSISYTTDKKRLQSVIETAAHRNYVFILLHLQNCLASTNFKRYLNRLSLLTSRAGQWNYWRAVARWTGVSWTMSRLRCTNPLIFSCLSWILHSCHQLCGWFATKETGRLLSVPCLFMTHGVKRTIPHPC